jgi:hypothetical protein
MDGLLRFARNDEKFQKIFQSAVAEIMRKTISRYFAFTRQTESESITTLQTAA